MDFVDGYMALYSGKHAPLLINFFEQQKNNYHSSLTSQFYFNFFLVIRKIELKLGSVEPKLNNLKKGQQEVGRAQFN